MFGHRYKEDLGSNGFSIELRLIALFVSSSAPIIFLAHLKMPQLTEERIVAPVWLAIEAIHHEHIRETRLLQRKVKHGSYFSICLGLTVRSKSALERYKINVKGARQKKMEAKRILLFVPHLETAGR